MSLLFTTRSSISFVWCLESAFLIVAKIHDPYTIKRHFLFFFFIYWYLQTYRSCQSLCSWTKKKLQIMQSLISTHLCICSVAYTSRLEQSLNGPLSAQNMPFCRAAQQPRWTTRKLKQTEKTLSKPCLQWVCRRLCDAHVTVNWLCIVTTEPGGNAIHRDKGKNTY